MVQVTIAVSKGRIGVGCLNAEGTGFLDEILLTPEPEAATVELLVATPNQRGGLVVRNASTSGPSEARLDRIGCYALGPEDDTQREPALTAPRPDAEWSRYYGTAGETAVEKLRVKRFETLQEPLVLRWSDGLTVRILPGDRLSRALYVSGTYEPNTLVVLRQLLRAGDIFLDAGANVGVISLVASRFVGPAGYVFSFEPSEREFSRMVNNLGRNDAPNIRPIRAAVTSSEGTATLRVAPASFAGLNTLGTEFPYEGVETQSLETVRTCTLDGFVSETRVERVAVVKLDIEGAEVWALRGATELLKQHRPALILEVFSRSLEANGCTRDDLEQLLNATGYRFFAIDDDASLLALGGLEEAQEQNVVALPAGHRLVR
jgi:FkbM family methyltransferase